jgi:prevent-host-death family protein
MLGFIQKERTYFNSSGQEWPPYAVLDIAISDSYYGRMEVSVADAKNKLPELIRAVEGGEPVIICRRGVPVVEIVRTKKPSRKKRTLGTLKGKIQVLDSNWWKPMTDEEVDNFLSGRL